MTKQEIPFMPQPLCSARSQPRRRQKKLKFLRGFKLREIADLRERRVPASGRILSSFPGKVETQNPRQIAIYAHYNSRGRISAMVLAQLEILRDEGFDTLFVSMSDIGDPILRAMVEPLVRSMAVRKSFGRDFGAWHDMAMIHKTLLQGADEVLLINDSMLGPILPLSPIFDGMRAKGEGLFGLTDSPDQQPHLQSYFLLFRGRTTITAMNDFFQNLKLSFHKETMIRRGEISLSSFMKTHGIPLWASFPFNELEAKVISDKRYLQPLLACYDTLLPEQVHPIGIEIDDAVFWRMRIKVALMRLALNPTHFYWRALIEVFRFPYIKTNLLTENPACIPDLTDWHDLIPKGAQVTATMIMDHLNDV